MVPASRLSTTSRRLRVVQEFNAGKTQAQIAAEQGLTRGAVGRLIAEARALGIPTIHYTKSQSNQRANASYREKHGDQGWSERQRRAWAVGKARAEVGVLPRPCEERAATD